MTETDQGGWKPPLTQEEVAAAFDALSPKERELFCLVQADGRFYVEQEKPRDAAFLFHQAVERLYHCTLLTFTLYSPKSHKLNFLRGQAEDLAPSLIEAWPRVARFDRRCFELLRLAYVNARYSPEYKISGEELAWISERVGILQELVGQVCEQRLAELEAVLPKAAE